MILIIKMLVWLIGVIGGNLAWHIYGIVKKKSKPNYELTIILRGMACVLFGIWLTPRLDWSPDLQIDHFFPAFGYCAFTYFLIYNPAMAFLKNKFADAVKVGYWYLGKTSGPLDRMLTRYPVVYKVAYFASIPGVVYCVYLIFQRY